MRLSSTAPIREALNDLDYPASKQEIVDHARRRGAAREAERALAALPLGEYANLTEVLRSVPVDPAPGRTEAQRSHQRRRPRGQVAEHLRDWERPF